MVLTSLSFLCLLLLFTMSPFPFLAHTDFLSSNRPNFFFLLYLLVPCILFRLHFLSLSPRVFPTHLPPSSPPDFSAAALHSAFVMCVCVCASIPLDLTVSNYCVARHLCNRSAAHYATKGNNDVELEMLLYTHYRPTALRAPLNVVNVFVAFPFFVRARFSASCTVHVAA